MSIYLADVNVLVALSLSEHPFTKVANEWYQREGRPCLQVCRIVQLGFLRTLTTQAAAGTGTLTNKAAWNLHSELVRQGLVVVHPEPASLETFLEDRVSLNQPAPKRWSDAYLSAFATAASLRLVTFDVALAGYTPSSTLLRLNARSPA
jgi:toxin-antitoxin system PIN domain toxin